jgi:hypothetical protein
MLAAGRTPETRATGPRKETAQTAAAHRPALAQTPVTQITLTARHGPALAITVRVTR